MKKTLLVFLILMFSAGLALADGMRAQEPVAEDGSTLMPEGVVPIPFSLTTDSPGEVIGTTTYDYQSNGSMGKKITVDEFGGVHVVFTRGQALASRPRNVSYNFRDETNSLWSFSPDGTDISAENGTGFVTCDLMPGGEILSAFHSADAIPSYSNVGIDAFRGFGIFSLSELPVGGEFIWPYVALDINNRMHMVAAFNSGAGATLPMAYTYSTDNGVNWANWQDLPDSISGLSYTITTSPVSAKTAILFADTTSTYITQVYYYETQDGITWDFRNPTNITQYTFDDSLSAYTDLDGLYDNNDNLHIVYCQLPSYGDARYLGDNQVMHWSEATGSSQIAINPDSACFQINYCICTAKPSLGVDANNNLYCAWSEMNTDDYSLNGYSNGEIYVSGSTNGGLFWSDKVNITNSPTPDCAAGDCDSDVWLSLAEVVNDSLHIMYIDDNDPGAAWNPNGSSVWTWNAVLYLTYPAADLLSGIDDDMELPFDFKLGNSYPNPFNAETIIPLEGEVHQGNVTIYDISGRQIRDFAIDENTYQIRWDGTNSAGETVASGLYFYSVSFDDYGTAATRKMTLLK